MKIQKLNTHRALCCGTRQSSRAARLLAAVAAFTMIEIAISLAIIGFALVAIIGILPMGMNVQKENRHETIVNQDASVFLNAIRGGELGVDDLTNYVISITRTTTAFNPRGGRGSKSEVIYTFTNSTFSSGGAGSTSPPYPITNGFRIIGLLSTPEKISYPNGSFLSNHIVAIVRSISGPASEKFPQHDPVMQQFGLTYRLVSGISSYGTNYYFPTWTNFGQAGLSTNEMVARSNYMMMVKSYETNLHDMRLTFRWPVLPNGDAGPNRQIFRTSVGGVLIQTNEPGFQASHCTIFYFEPRTFFRGT